MITTRRRRIASAVLTLALAVAGCGHGPVEPEEVRGPFTWGSLQGVMRVRHLWIAGQPDGAALEAARAEGIGVVIDLRSPEEHAWDERAAAEALGLTYHNVPIPGGVPFAPPTFETLESLVEQHEGEQVLVHCASGNRAAGWLATHLVTRHAMEPADALAVARRAGLTKQAVEERVTAYLDRDR